MSLKIIDPHVHFFNLAEGQYTWLQGENPPAWPNLELIKQPISEKELLESSDFTLVGIVHIEAGFDNNAPINELNWLTAHLKKLPFKAISYAQLDCAPVQFAKAINALAHPHLIGIRDITEGADAQRLLNPECFSNLQTLCQQGLHYEAQFELENTAIAAQLARYAKALPQLKIIINHGGLPNNINNWQQSIRMLSAHNNIAIKFSGFELLALNLQQQQDCFETMFSYFGEQRIMFASNFPVCQINASYNDVW
ncbi:MAG: amidohydrolase family protein, partial [Pseudoalteromonas sp.]|nr:amidohydrolase family protein [Pseudoalteromonas sp.]